jgi:hypothetical protein
MTLVSIVGDFFSSVAPIFYEFKDKIDTHIIISDDSKRDDRLARKFEKGVNNFTKKYDLNIKTYFYSIDEDSFESLEGAKNFILNNSKGEIYINTTDGLSSINTFFSLRMLPLGAKIISYDMFDNEYHIIDINGMKRNKIKKSVPIIDHFLLKGVDINSKGTKSFALRYEEEIKELFEEYHYEYRGFKFELTTKNKLPSRKDFPNIYYLFDKMNLTSRNLNDKTLFQILTGDMFEYYVYLLVRDLGFDDIEIGVEIEDGGVRNEFDILLMKDNHLHVIECKHRGFKTLDLEELIYKYATLRRVVDEDAKGVIVTLINKYSKNFINRALSQNIALFGFNKNLQQNIKKFLIEGSEYEFYDAASSKNGFTVKDRNFTKRTSKSKKRVR